MKLCIVIPVYNHQQAIASVLARLKPYGLPCLLVNDGSDMACRQVLLDCVAQHSDWLTLIDRAVNGGKGAAVIDGFIAARRLGYSHAIQIDADGQHDTDAILLFIQQCQLNPEAMILGVPRFSADAPNSRRYGRQFTNLWIWINTLSLAIGDGMCGFRLYPLKAVHQLLQTNRLAQGMAFDIDIVVRLFWQGVKTQNLPVSVNYPPDGVSHFKLCRDNLLISQTHARLFFGMLKRMPSLLARHCS